MLHIHFGAGRLGLGLVAPFFQTGRSELQILNRSISSAKPTAETSLGSRRRNELLRDDPRRCYRIQTPGGSPGVPREVRYDGFATYDENSIEAAVAAILAGSAAKAAGVVVTASLLQAENYRPVILALNRIAALGEAHGALGPIFFVACENALSAEEVLGNPVLSELIAPPTRERVTAVRALVDRLCVDLEEVATETGPSVVARAELYGSLKLELNDRTETLQELCAGSRVSFTRHIDAERKIKSWLVNGSHWLIALAALEDNHGHQGFALNQYLAASDKNRAFAVRVMEEMKEGVAIVIRTDPQYADFAREVNVGEYLDGAASAILKRFFETEDPITRILARFRAPSSEAFTTIEAFSKRFNDRVGEPMRAYEHENGVAPPAASHSLFSMLQLVASGSFIEDRPH